MKTNLKKKNILIFGYHDINRDPRALRQIKWLSEFCDVSYISQIPDSNLDASFIRLEPLPKWERLLRNFLLVMRCYNKYSWSSMLKGVFNKVNPIRFDLVIVHHINLLPIAAKLENVDKIILDAHEYYPEVYDEAIVWRLLMKPYYAWLCRQYLNKCDLVIAVNESMQKRYSDDYLVNADFITNAVDFEDQYPRPVNSGEIKLLHHGLASPSRQLEKMIYIMDFTDFRFTLTFILLEINKTSSNYVTKLKKLAKNNPNIKFETPVDMKDIVSLGNNYDIGLFFMPPTNYNEEYSLANKVFQFVQSRLMLAFSPLPEMKKIVLNNNLGIVSEDFEPCSMAHKLNALKVEEIYSYKEQSHNNALKLSSISNKNKFLTLVSNLIGYND
jgi:hypothetical protein